MKKLIIIGAGPVGLYASYLAGLKGIDTVVYEANSHVGGQPFNLYPTKPILDIPGFGSIMAGEFIEKLSTQAYKYGNVKFELNKRVEDIVANSNNTVTIKGGDFEDVADYVLLTGGKELYQPRRLEVEGYESQSNILYFLPPDIKFENKKILILGGGDSAIDWANELSLKNDVSLVHRSENFRANFQNVEKMKLSTKIYTPYRIKEVIGNPATSIVVTNIKTKEEKFINFDICLVFYGSVRSKDSIISLFEHDDRGILVDRFHNTSIMRVYACGDICSYEAKAYVITAGFGEVYNVISNLEKEINPNKKTDY